MTISPEFRERQVPPSVLLFPAIRDEANKLLIERTSNADAFNTYVSQIVEEDVRAKQDKGVEVIETEKIRIDAENEARTYFEFRNSAVEMSESFFGYDMVEPKFLNIDQTDEGVPTLIRLRMNLKGANLPSILGSEQVLIWSPNWGVEPYLDIHGDGSKEIYGHFIGPLASMADIIIGCEFPPILAASGDVNSANFRRIWWSSDPDEQMRTQVNNNGAVYLEWLQSEGVPPLRLTEGQCSAILDLLPDLQLAW